jgi:uncharacterized protein YbaP (TraB family)
MAGSGRATIDNYPSWRYNSFKFFIRGNHMKRFFFVGAMIIGLLASFASCANPNQNSLDNPPDNFPDNPPSLSKASVWKISKDGNSLFLGGSVHLLRAQDLPMPAAFDDAYDQAATLVLEADVDRMSDPAMLQYQEDALTLPEGQTLQTVLEEAVYQRLETAIGGPAALGAISRYKPSVVINSLQLAYLQAFGFTEDGADFYYLAKAKEDDKARDFLEDITVQIDMLSSMAEGSENEYVSAALDEILFYANGVDALVSEWKAGTAALLEASLDAQKATWPAIHQTTVVDRNTAWLPKIEEYLTTEPVEFVIVGLAHVHGEDGLLIQLQDKGYAIEQLVN